MKKTIIFVIIILLVLILLFFGFKYFAGNKNKEASKEVDTSLSKVKERGVLIVGTNLPFEPIVYYDEAGRIVGFDANLIREIASRLGVEAKLQDVPWNGIFDDLKAEKFDVIIDGITITPERQEEMLFSAPYLSAGQLVVTRVDNEDITKPEDLAGKKVAVLKDTTCEDAALLYVDPSNILEYESQDIVTENLKNKNADAMVVDYIVAVNAVKNNPDLKIATNQFTKEFYGIATRLENEVLMNKINDILREMTRTGEIEDLKAKWLR